MLPKRKNAKPSTVEPPQAPSFLQAALRRMDHLSGALRSPPAQVKAMQAALGVLFEGWGSRSIELPSTWDSDITDDHSPFELSLSSCGDRMHLRALVEASPSHVGNMRDLWHEGLELNRRIDALDPGALARFDTIADLFVPDPTIQSRFAMWHAVSVDGEGRAKYKLYLNPHGRHASAASDVTRSALQRLGLRTAWTQLEPLLAAGDNQVVYFSLDLGSGANARAKVYLAHPRVRAASLEQQLACVPGYTPGIATKLLMDATGFEGPFSRRPILSCLSFTDAQTEPDLTLHAPVRCYVTDDQEALRGLERLVQTPGAVRRAVCEFARRPLDAGVGLLTYISRRVERNKAPVLTVYLSPELYKVTPVADARPVPERDAFGESVSTTSTSMLDVEHYIRDHKAVLAEHPFVRLLENEQAGLAAGGIAKSLSFFVMSFQDVLRLAARHIKRPVLTDIARDHYAEDRGHEQWFLHDLSQLGGAADVGHIFSTDHEVPRDVGYELVAEVIRTPHDEARLSVVHSLEAAGDLFFARVVQAFELRGLSDGLQYFARHHHEVEVSHTMFEREAQERLGAVTMSSDVVQHCKATVDFVFGQMKVLADYMLPRSLSTGTHTSETEQHEAVGVLNA